MILYSCDFCGYIIRGSFIELDGKHYCSTDCCVRHRRGERFNPDKPTHEIQKLETVPTLQVPPTQGIRWASKTQSKLF